MNISTTCVACVGVPAYLSGYTKTVCVYTLHICIWKDKRLKTNIELICVHTIHIGIAQIARLEIVMFCELGFTNFF